MKRKIALLVAGIMATSSMSVPAFAANFKDINDVPWEGAKEIINSVADKGLLSGYEDNTFRAKNNVTFVESMQMVYNVMDKAGVLQTLLATDHYKYIAIMDTYGIPSWAQRAVAYGLNFSIISMEDLGKFMTNGKSNYATREEVAKIFGNAFAARYSLDSKAPNAMAFNDNYRIADDCLFQIDLLARLGIVNGNESNSFAPKNNINRAEMAVMLNRSFDVLNQGVEQSGTITDISYDGYTYTMKVKYTTGVEERLYATAGLIAVTTSDGSTVSLARLSKGDNIKVTFNGDAVTKIVLVDGTDLKTKYDITGYVSAIKDETITFENENTGDSEKYNLSSNCLFFLDGVKTTRSAAATAVTNATNEYAYAGMNTTTEVEKGSGLTQEYNTYISEVYLTFVDEYSRTGEVKAMENSYIRLLSADGAESVIYFATDCEYEINGESSTLAKAKTFGNSGTVYAKVSVNKQNKATKVSLAEESFTAQNDSTHIYTVTDFTESRIVVDSGASKTTYSFGSTNPLSNITFYTWDTSDEDWVEVTRANAERYYDKLDNAGSSTYVKVEFNSGGKINKVYLSSRKSAFTDVSGSLTQRNGNVASLSGNTLKLENSTLSYTLLSQYNATTTDPSDSTTVVGTNPNTGVGWVKNPLAINGAPTSSLTAFKKLAGSEDVTLDVQLKIDGNRNILSIVATPVEATGTIVEFDLSEKLMTIETSEGSTIKFETTGKPLTGSGTYTIENLTSNSYKGSTVLLNFNESGLVNKVTLKTNTNTNKNAISGVAVSAADGLKLEGSSTVYGWGASSKMTITNRSMASVSLDRMKALIDDPDVDVFVDAILDPDTKRVLVMEVTVQGAEGEFQEYNSDAKTVRILTSAGNKFAFYLTEKVTLDIDDIAESKLNSQAVGKDVTITFNSDGLGTKVKG